MPSFRENIDYFIRRVLFKLFDLKLLRPRRGEYKKTWNIVGKDLNLAKIAVAGFSDDAEFRRSGKDTAETIMQACQITKDDIVLEIGCGVGRIGAELAKHCKKWIGTDISGQMIKFARQQLKPLPNVELIELAQSNLSEIPDDSIDKLYCSVVFMHLDEWDRYRYVTEAFRVLKPGGVCYFDNLNLAGELGWKIFLEHSAIAESERQANISKSSTEEELLIYLRNAGFTNIKSYPGSHLVGVRGFKPQQ